MRLSRFFIASLFILFLSFGIKSQAFAQIPANCRPDTTNPNYNNCVNGGAGYFYSHQAPPIDCRIITCSLSYTPGAFPKSAPNVQQNLDASSNCANGSMDAQCFIAGTSGFNSKTGKASYVGATNYIMSGITANILGGSSTDGSYLTAGAIQSTTTMMAAAYQNLPNTQEYVADLIHDVRNPFLAQTAYAQGLGFSALSPILGVWKIMRNLAYFFFVVIFLFVGFAIMFRSKIGGQAAVTVQQALPKLIVSLLLVTFSYAIAGLMIDVMYIIIYLIIGVFSVGSVFPNGLIPSFAGAPNGLSLTDLAFRNTIFANLFALMGGTLGNIGGAVFAISSNTLETNLGFNPALAAGAGGIANILTQFILAIFILVSMFRIFFALLQSYIMIFFSVIFAPIQLLLGALPGQNTFRAWIQGLFENLIVFPTIILMLILAFYFSSPASHPAGVGPGFSAPQLGSNQNGGQTTYLALISLGVIGALPDIIKISKGVAKGKLDVDVGNIGQNLSKGWKGGEIIPGVAATSIGGVSQFPGYAAIGTTKGKESGIERMFLGSRERRAKEAQYQREIYDKTGVDILRKRGGAYGVFTNKEIDRRNAEKLETAGSKKR